MLELVKVDDKLTIKGSEDFIKKTKDEAENMTKFPPSGSTILVCMTKRANTKKDITAYRAQVEALEKMYLAPLAVALAPIVKAIDSLDKALDDYADKLLTCQKNEFKEKARKRFVTLAGAMSKTGEIPDFETFYDPSWYSRCKTNDSLDDAIIAKLKRSEEVEDDKATATFSIKGSAKIKIVEDFLISSRINYEKI